MNGWHVLSYFFGGLCSANFVPHFVVGIMGSPFQSPFAKPHGQALSSSTVNVLWGLANGFLAYLLVVRVGRFDPRNAGCILPFTLGVVLISLFSARHFGRFNGGNNPGRS
jgi:hypothetical protein